MSAAITWTRTYIRYSSNRAADAAGSRPTSAHPGAAQPEERGEEIRPPRKPQLRRGRLRPPSHIRGDAGERGGCRPPRPELHTPDKPPAEKAGLDSCRYLLTTERGKKSGAHTSPPHYLGRPQPGRDGGGLGGRGRANCLRLQFDRDSGITGLSMYITKDRAMYKRWSGSRNLIQPEPMQRDGALALDDLDELGEAAEAGSAITR